nr:MAG TPA: hypothetical protein [Bacteriophage sp.]
MASEYPYMKRGRCIHEKNVSLVVCANRLLSVLWYWLKHGITVRKIRHIQSKSIPRAIAV